MASSGRARPPAVAGTFYPADPTDLRLTVDDLLAGSGASGPVGEAIPDGSVVEGASSRLEALIVPHAGYIYSGPIAATAYRALADRIAGRGSANGAEVERIVLIGPSHFVPIRGLALPATQSFATPLGEVELDRDAVESLRHRPEVEVRDDAHAREHSLEVQLPFLQRILGEFELVPLTVGFASPEEVARVLDSVWTGEETVVVASSDLSHYLPYAEAKRIDHGTAVAIERLDAEALRPEQACGCHAVQGLLFAARERGLACRLVDLRSSGDTAGSRDRVVGYGAFLLERSA